MPFVKVGELKTGAGQTVDIYDDDSETEESDTECDCKEGECECNLNCAICDTDLTDFEDEAFYYDKNQTWMCEICYAFTLDNE